MPSYDYTMPDRQTDSNLPGPHRSIGRSTAPLPRLRMLFPLRNRL